MNRNETRRNEMKRTEPKFIFGVRLTVFIPRNLFCSKAIHALFDESFNNKGIVLFFPFHNAKPLIQSETILLVDLFSLFSFSMPK